MRQNKKKNAPKFETEPDLFSQGKMFGHDLEIGDGQAIDILEKRLAASIFLFFLRHCYVIFFSQKFDSQN